MLSRCSLECMSVALLQESVPPSCSLMIPAGPRCAPSCTSTPYSHYAAKVCYSSSTDMLLSNRKAQAGAESTDTIWVCYVVSLYACNKFNISQAVSASQHSYSLCPGPLSTQQCTWGCHALVILGFLHQTYLVGFTPRCASLHSVLHPESCLFAASSCVYTCVQTKGALLFHLCCSSTSSSYAPEFACNENDSRRRSLCYTAASTHNIHTIANWQSSTHISKK